jgi:hypothetical protein
MSCQISYLPSIKKGVLNNKCHNDSTILLYLNETIFSNDLYYPSRFKIINKACAPKLRAFTTLNQGFYKESEPIEVQNLYASPFNLRVSIFISVLPDRQKERGYICLKGIKHTAIINYLKEVGLAGACKCKPNQPNLIIISQEVLLTWQQ